MENKLVSFMCRQPLLSCFLYDNRTKLFVLAFQTFYVFVCSLYVLLLYCMHEGEVCFLGVTLKVYSTNFVLHFHNVGVLVGELVCPGGGGV